MWTHEERKEERSGDQDILYPVSSGVAGATKCYRQIHLVLVWGFRVIHLMLLLGFGVTDSL